MLDQEFCEMAKPILLHTIFRVNNRVGAQHSEYFPEQHSKYLERKKDVELQWNEAALELNSALIFER